MTVIGPDTILLASARLDRRVGPGRQRRSTRRDFYGEIGLARINLRWLESPNPYEFSWYFNEEAARRNRPTTAVLAVQDYGPWDQRAWARASNANVAARYVAGPAGDTRVAIDQPAPAKRRRALAGLQHGAARWPNDSFTVQIDAQDDRYAWHDHRHPARTFEIGRCRSWTAKCSFRCSTVTNLGRDHQPGGHQRRPVAPCRGGSRCGRADCCDSTSTTSR